MRVKVQKRSHKDVIVRPCSYDFTQQIGSKNWMTLCIQWGLFPLKGGSPWSIGLSEGRGEPQRPVWGPQEMRHRPNSFSRSTWDHRLISNASIYILVHVPSNKTIQSLVAQNCPKISPIPAGGFLIWRYPQSSSI